MLVLVHAVRTPEERDVHTLLLRRLRTRGFSLATTAWDRGLVFMDLEAFGPVHEIESINRWRLPQVLARVGLKPVARYLRHRRVRGWWRADGPPDAVIALGRLRPEMAHYIPPGAGPVGLVVGWREAEGAESVDATLALADRVLAVDEAEAVAVRAAGRDPVVRTPRELVTSAGPAPGRPAAAGAPLLVTGVGPGDWRGAADLFLRVAAAVAAGAGDREVRFAWSGLDPTDGRSFPYLYDTHHLGLDADITWLDDPDAALAAVGRSAAIVLTGRAPFALPIHPFVDAVGPTTFLPALGVPVLGFDTPAVAALAGADPTLVRYPDVPALAEALASRLGDAVVPDLDRVIDAVVDFLLAQDG